MGSQLRLTVILGFGIPYILYQKLLCLLLVCNSPTLSGISTSQPERGVISLGSQLRLIVVLGIGIPYILYHKYTVPTSGMHLSNTFRYFYF